MCQLRTEKRKVIPKIVFEDESLLVVDKPAGLVVNRAETQKEETLEDWAGKKITGVERSGIVHRLDKDTSGLLVVAKTPQALANLQAQFKGREVVKKYLALVHGKVEPLVGTIDAPIDRNPFNRMRFGVFPGGREAKTDYKSLKSLKSLTLLELTPHTGRTHQIRVHLKYINHPIVADPIYGGRKNYQADLKFCPRLFLHATFLRFKHPETGTWLEFSVSLPSDLAEVLQLLG
ncbi:RluA family pseudouridine synthase [Candidatus Microgenomates bacterium]|nr:RluA family pseudouridine synthase [Candidatus Microgenomates bacterium]